MLITGSAAECLGTFGGETFAEFGANGVGLDWKQMLVKVGIGRLKSLGLDLVSDFAIKELTKIIGKDAAMILVYFTGAAVYAEFFVEGDTAKFRYINLLKKVGTQRDIPDATME